MKNVFRHNRYFRAIVLAADTVVFSFVLFLPICTVFLRKTKSKINVLIYFGILCIVLLARYGKARADRIKQTRRDREEEQIEQILLMNDSELSDRLHTDGFMLIRKAEPDRFDILDSVRSGAKAVGLMRADGECIKLIRKYAPEAVVYDRNDLLRIIFHEDGSPGKCRMKAYAVYFNKYVLLGFILLISSFFLRYRIYLRTVSCICFLIGLFVKRVGKK